MQKLICCIVFILNIYSLAHTRILREDFISKQKRYIYSLYLQNDYFNCIAETQRLVNYPDNIYKNDYLYFIDACYYMGGQYKTVIYKLQDIKSPKENKASPENLFLLANSYFKIGDISAAWEVLAKLDYPNVGNDERERLFCNRAEELLRTYRYNDLLKEIDSAGEYINVFNNNFMLNDFRKDIERYNEIGLKSKWLSLSLSAVVPGAGQLYSGRVWDALLSFAAVGGSAFASYYFYHKKEKPLAITFAFFTGLFYCGNLYGAYNSASYSNERTNQRFMNAVTKKYGLEYNPFEYLNNGIFE